jgi:AcrR family transcriptional regulator
MKLTRNERTSGRPRGFDKTAALAAAMRVFWEKGFQGASLSDLTEAMGINPPSLYAAFGNKESLFLHALQAYAEGPASYALRCVEEPTARRVAERRLRETVNAMCAGDRRSGCLAVRAITGMEALSVSQQEEIRRMNELAYEALVHRFRRAKKEGDLPPDASPTALARLLTTITAGISVQAMLGTPRKELQEMADLALKNWPGK